MGLLDEISGFVNDLLGRKNNGPSFGDIDRQVASKPPPSSRDRITSPTFDISDIEPTQEYQIAHEILKRKEPFLFVTGRAGTGKTTFIRWLCHTFDGNVAVVAPTGLAALTAGGQTIHSFFKLRPGFTHLDEIKKLRHRAVYENLDLLIIDEVSMVRADMMDVIERFLRLNGPNPDRPFGGVPILAIGDMHQLPPIADTDGIREYLETNYRSPYFFSAHSVSSVEPKSLELKRVFRQKDQQFLKTLNQIRTGDNLDDAVQKINVATYDSGYSSSEWTTLVPTRKLAHQINEQHLSQLPGNIHEFVGSIEGRFFSTQNYKNNNEEEMDKMLPAPYRLQLREGARVVFLTNGRAWVNGTAGTVKGFKDGVVQVQIDDRGSNVVVDVQKHTWGKNKYEYDQEKNRLAQRPVGSFTQYPLALGWAMTIHKAQGQTLDKVIVDLDWGTFASGQAYVALSRARTIDGLKLRRKLKASDIRSDALIRQLYQVIEKNDIARQWQAAREGQTAEEDREHR